MLIAILPPSVVDCYSPVGQAWCDVPNHTVRLVFHGTAQANIDAICRDSLDSSKRTGQAQGKGEYFGIVSL